MRLEKFGTPIPVAECAATQTGCLHCLEPVKHAQLGQWNGITSLRSNDHMHSIIAEMD
jgi:hypothetical protein